MNVHASVDRAARFLVVSDPGQLRLRSAAQTTATLVLALALLTGVTHALGQPVTVAMLGTVVAMFSSFAVKDKSAHDRLVTTALLVLPAIAAVSLSSTLDQFGWPADVGFIVVLFTAVYVRRFGPRGFALGMAGFISYFFALFLKAAPTQIPVLALAIVVGIASSMSVRTLFAHERAGAELERLTRALRASCTSVLELAAQRNRGPRAEHDIREGLERLANTALMIEDWLDRNEASMHLSVTGADLSRKIFDAQQATEQLVVALGALESGEWNKTLDRVMLALTAALQNSPTDRRLDAVRREVTAAEKTTTGGSRTDVAIRSAVRAARVHIAVHRVAAHAMEERPGEPDEPPKDDSEEKPGLLPSIRAAIQVAIATSVATVVGELVSPDRWYWAVLSAFVVFTGTSTRGEILTRAGHRVVGTIGGVFAGVLLSALVGDRPVVQVVLIIVCVFCAFYLVTIANGLLVFFITVLLAMLYGLLGTFSIAVLELRIVETAVGATVGITAAFFILPIRTRATLVEKVDDYVDKLDEVVRASIDSIAAPGSGVDLIPGARDLDTALQDVQTAAKPLEIGPTSRARRGTARLVRVLEACDRSAHSLVRAGMVSASAEPSTALDDHTICELRRGADIVLDSLGVLRSAVRGDVVAGEVDTDESPLVEMLGRGQSAPGALRIAVRALDRLQRSAALTRVQI